MSRPVTHDGAQRDNSARPDQPIDASALDAYRPFDHYYLVRSSLIGEVWAPGVRGKDVEGGACQTHSPPIAMATRFTSLGRY